MDEVNLLEDGLVDVVLDSGGHNLPLLVAAASSYRAWDKPRPLCLLGDGSSRELPSPNVVWKALG